MKLEVRELLSGEGAVYTIPFHEMVDSQVEDLPFPSPVDGEITLLHLGRTIHVAGKVSTLVTLTCSRCLESFPYTLEATLDEDFFASPQPPRSPVEEVRLSREDFIFPLPEGGILDVTELVRQNLIMAIPIKPVCKESCQGLCPQCGANRNVEPCDCTLTEVDPRLAVLEQLLRERA
ncbi:MAG: DUF177 domain-containing protein [Armatimonadota bacterium]|nr:DUF177 domain-containing protein [Armatimonadota bacterium]MDR5703578.1 DUF177 domain-containing protein [Armatimonadota bacterium]MDR7435156.1 DUF177 domain-containing protein [Armatimonadota bacterium]